MVTDSHIAHFIAMFIVFVVACSFSIGWAKTDGIKPFSDKFELGYIEEDGLPISPVEVQVVDEYDELKDLERQVKIAKLKKQLHDINNPKASVKPVKPVKVAKQSKPTKPAIFDDCVSALTGLGTPARKAKAEAEVVFERNPNIKTVQEFITEYGKR